MNLNLITYEDKVTLNENASISAINKCQASDLNQIKDVINNQLLDLFYPIGTYYETSDTSFDPNVSWGGTWELDTDGTVLASKSLTSGSAFNVDVGTIVGEEEHTLTIDEMPSHTHEISNLGSTVLMNTGNTYGTYIAVGTSYTNSTGDNQSHNIIQPTKVANRWHRTA